MRLRRLGLPFAAIDYKRRIWGLLVRRADAGSLRVGELQVQLHAAKEGAFLGATVGDGVMRAVPLEGERIVMVHTATGRSREARPGGDLSA